MIDKRALKDTNIYTEMTDFDIKNWFDIKKEKFLHQVDTFYYSIKLKEDFTPTSKDSKVLKFRNYFQQAYKVMESKPYDFVTPMNFGNSEHLNLRNGSFAHIFNIHLERPEHFDIFIASKVPNGSDGGASKTTEIVVQLRSYMLWMYGVVKSYEMSMTYVESLLHQFDLTIDFVQENRVDYAWHTNALKNPEYFFSPENFYKMRVDRFKDCLIHTAKVGMSDFEIDYLAMGKRSDKVFIRIYLKSKEVIEKNYKPWFFKVWLFNGLINRYDFYCYEKCYVKRSWQYMNVARLHWYKEYGNNEKYLKEVNDILDKKIEMSPKSLKELADRLTPPVTLIMNVEYQTMRKHTKSYELLPLKDNSNKGVAKRLYDYFDNRKIICDYLTHHTFRMVQITEDSNKSRNDYCNFWKRLRNTKMVDVKLTPEEIKLTRNYTRNLNAEKLKKRVLNSAVIYGIYTRGINNDDVTQDFVEVLCQLNDNDLHDVQTYKNKKLSQFNEDELQETFVSSSKHQYNIIDIDTGEIIE